MRAALVLCRWWVQQGSPTHCRGDGDVHVCDARSPGVYRLARTHGRRTSTTLTWIARNVEASTYTFTLLVAPLDSNDDERWYLKAGKAAIVVETRTAGN